MKVRIGVGLGTRSVAADGGEAFAALVDGLEAHRFDSLWVADRVGGPGPDPVAAMAFAAGRTTRLKVGMSVMVLPGRNPALVAKALASVDRLSGGRLLPAFGLGAVDPHEQQAFGVAREERAAVFDEVLPLLRRFWAGEEVHHEGPRYRYRGVRVRPTPVQDHLDVWMGGLAPAELRRVGRLADGWLPSFCTAEEVGRGIVAVREAAEAHGRHIDDEHHGALLAYAHGELPDALAAVLARRRPGVELTDVVAPTRAHLRPRIEAMLERGASKFVVLPLVEPPSWDDELGALAAELLPLET